jgi:hypothetical protein
MSQPRLPFLATLNLPDLSKLMNEPVCHDPTWPPIPHQASFRYSEFEGKNGEDPGDHVTTFHLWCSSNSLNDDSIRLRLFQHTLIGVSMKWYIELPRGAYGTFSQMVLVFLNHFQLLGSLRCWPRNFVDLMPGQSHSYLRSHPGVA